MGTVITSAPELVLYFVELTKPQFACYKGIEPLLVIYYNNKIALLILTKDHIFRMFLVVSFNRSSI